MIFALKLYPLKRFLILPVLLFFVNSLTAQNSFSNDFMNIGVDARAFGMSNAVVASVGDVSSGYWNPAGLMALESKQISLMHANYFANIASYDYASFAMPLDDGQSAFGFSLVRFGVDDILDTRSLIDSGGNIVTNFEDLPTFSTADYGFLLSYARSNPEGSFRYGANAKIIRRIIGDFANSWGFGFDVGAQWVKEDWQLGLMLRDITTTFNTWQIEDGIFDDSIEALARQELPETTEITLPKAQVGFAYNFEFGEHFDFTPELDLIMHFIETNAIISSSFVSMTPALGLELEYADVVRFRTGMGNFQKELQLDGSEKTTFQPNIGVGFHYKGFELDYSLTDIGDQSASIYSNIFSIKLDLSIFRK